MADLTEKRKCNLLFQTARVSLTQRPETPTWQEAFAWLEQNGHMTLPFSEDQLTWYPQRISLLSDIHRHAQSQLWRFIQEDPTVTVLVEDAVLPTGRNVFLVRSLEIVDWSNDPLSALLQEWLPWTQPEKLALRVLGMETQHVVVLLNLEAFVRT